MKFAWALLFLLLLAGQAQVASIPGGDQVRMREFYRLSSGLQDSLWPGWSKVAAPILLVTEHREYLVHAERAPQGFAPEADGVYSRPRMFPVNLLATFPAFGPPAVIVIGEPANTDQKTSTPWLLTLMHEHFHQLQYAAPGYQAAVEALGLSHGDSSGMWMLNYPFPYDDAATTTAFAALRDQLLSALHEPDAAKFGKLARDYARQRDKFMRALKPEDRKYISFQIWQEGIARYTQIKAAEAAKEYQPSAEYRAVADYQPFAKFAAAARNDTLDELKRADLKEWKRTAFYSFGAAEGMLLDRSDPSWKDAYFKNLLSLDPYFAATTQQ